MQGTKLHLACLTCHKRENYEQTNGQLLSDANTHREVACDGDALDGETIALESARTDGRHENLVSGEQRIKKGPKFHQVDAIER